MPAIRALLVIALSAVLTIGSVMTAHAAAFVADSKGHIQRSQGCSDGSFLCGAVESSHFGEAAFSFFIDGFAPTTEDCGVYDATIVFALADGSRLTLDDQGRVCGPGNSFFSTRAHTYGNPVNGEGAWVVQDATGAFEGLTGSGTSSFRNAGANVQMTHTGTLEG